jgi:biotin operon repressor
MSESSVRESDLALLNESARSELENADYQPLWAQDFVDTYLTTGDTMSFNNTKLHTASMLSLASRTLRGTKIQANNNQIPPAIHPIAIQKSGTGKSPAFKYAQMVAEMADISFRSQTDLTTAGLIGTVEDGEPKQGVAAQAEIVGFEEMSTLFRLTEREHSSNLGEHLNQIMDNKKVQKDLAHGTIAYKPKCTLFGTTYPPEDLDLERLLNNGTLARFFFFFKEIDRDFYRATLNDVIDSIVSDNPEELSRADFIENIGRLGTTLRIIRAHYDSGFVFSFDFEPEELNLAERMWSVYDEYPEVTKEIVEPAIIRYGIHAFRIGAVMAALDRCSESVKLSHMERAMDLFEQSWRQMLDYYSENYQRGLTELDSESKTKFKIVQSLALNDSVSQSELADIVGVSTRTIRKHADTLVLEGVITESGGNGTKKTYSLSDR